LCLLAQVLRIARSLQASCSATTSPVAIASACLLWLGRGGLYMITYDKPLSVV
jgi:hypothetical protein